MSPRQGHHDIDKPRGQYHADLGQVTGAMRHLTLPAKFYPVHVVHPSAAMSSKRLTSSQRVTPNPFVSHYVYKYPAVVDTTATLKAEVSNGSITIHPRRPPWSSLLDDLLSEFRYEHDVERDMRFQLTNSETGRQELCVVTGADYVQRDGSDGYVDFVLTLKQEEDEKS